MDFYLRRAIVYGLITIGVLFFALHIIGWFYFDRTAPTTPNVVSGEVYEVNNHGSLSYITETTYYTWSIMWYSAFLIVIAAWLLDQRWKVTRSAREKRYEKSKPYGKA